MLEKKIIRFIQLLCVGALTACQASPDSAGSSGQVSPTADPTENPAAQVSTPSATDTPAVESVPSAAPQSIDIIPESSAYQDGINLASSAVTLGQQATSSDDWDLVVSRWEQAIQKLKAVPTEHQHYTTAQTKITEYERNLAQVSSRLAKLKQPPPELSLNQPTGAGKPDSPTAGAASGATPGATSRIPIIERRGGIPVIEVAFNGKRYPMILDTGASHTHITRAMANELGVQVIGQASVATASNRQAVVDVGYVQSIRVANINRTNIAISIGDAVPIGLLGNDVYKNHDVILQVNSVEFRPR